MTDNFFWNPELPPRYATAKIEDVPADIMDKFNSIYQTRRGLFIHGTVGTGKTHIAYSLYKHRFSYNSIFWNTTELLRELRRDFDRPSEQKKNIEVELMTRRRLLFLDDVGAEKMSDWVAETFYLIVNKRYNEKLPIIFTSNCSIKELAEKVGDRIASRIVETCDIIRLDGADKRLQKKMI